MVHSRRCALWQYVWWKRAKKWSTAEARRCPGQVQSMVWIYENALYVWFPASWGLSVVEAISKRNQKWLQQHPVHRDPAMFNPLEVENGPTAREMRYNFFLLDAAWVKSRAERPSVSHTKVTARSRGQAI